MVMLFVCFLLFLFFVLNCLFRRGVAVVVVFRRYAAFADVCLWCDVAVFVFFCVFSVLWCLLRFAFCVTFPVVIVMLLRFLNVLNECVIAVFCWCRLLLFLRLFRLFAVFVLMVCCCRCFYWFCFFVLNCMFSFGVVVLFSVVSLLLLMFVCGLLLL